MFVFGSNSEGSKEFKSEAVSRGCSVKKKVFLEISQNSQEKNCARFSFLIKLQAKAFNLVFKDSNEIDNLLKCAEKPTTNENHQNHCNYQKNDYHNYHLSPNHSPQRF